jgi:hypothetical protein
MIALFPMAVLSAALASPPPDWLDQVKTTWESTTTYCGKVLFAVHSTDQALITTGKRCVEPNRGILTETDTPHGVAVDIRLAGEAWLYDPFNPVGIHLIAANGGEPPGNDIGEWVELLSQRSEQIELMEDIEIAGRAHWRFRLPQVKDGMNAIFMVDPDVRLPVALELRTPDRPILSTGYSNLTLNLEIPDTHFRLPALFHFPILEVEWDPAQDAKKAANDAAKAFQSGP